MRLKSLDASSQRHDDQVRGLSRAGLFSRSLAVGGALGRAALGAAELAAAPRSQASAARDAQDRRASKEGSRTVSFVTMSSDHMHYRTLDDFDHDCAVRETFERLRFDTRSGFLIQAGRVGAAAVGALERDHVRAFKAQLKSAAIKEPKSTSTVSPRTRRRFAAPRSPSRISRQPPIRSRRRGSSPRTISPQRSASTPWKPGMPRGSGGSPESCPRPRPSTSRSPTARWSRS
jgi:hypothetical protein